MIYYLYELYDTYGNVVWVGETRNTKRRLWQHKYKTGRFHGKDVTMVVIGTYENRSDAWEIQVQLQKEYGLETDRDKLIKAGKTMTDKRLNRLREHAPTIAKNGGYAKKPRKK